MFRLVIVDDRVSSVKKVEKKPTLLTFGQLKKVLQLILQTLLCKQKKITNMACPNHLPLF